MADDDRPDAGRVLSVRIFRHHCSGHFRIGFVVAASQAIARVRWFKLMMIMLAIAVPGFHLWARTTMLKLDASVRASQLDLAQASWHELGQAYAIALVVMLVITAIGIIRPRLGQR